LENDMRATTHTLSRFGALRQKGLIAATILAAAALAAAAVRFEAAAQAGSATTPQGQAGSTLPASAVVESVVAGDPSVPRASAVFRASSAAAEELPPTF
jgi:hypothetical protein